MYRIPTVPYNLAVPDNPAIFCQVQQFPESGNEDPTKNAQKHDKKVAKIPTLSGYLIKIFFVTELYTHLM